MALDPSFLTIFIGNEWDPGPVTDFGGGVFTGEAAEVRQGLVANSKQESSGLLLMTAETTGLVGVVETNVRQNDDGDLVAVEIM